MVAIVGYGERGAISNIKLIMHAEMSTLDGNNTGVRKIIGAGTSVGVVTGTFDERGATPA